MDYLHQAVQPFELDQAPDVEPRSAMAERSAIRRFGITVLAVAVVLAFRLSLSPVLGHESPFLLFVPAVMVAAWYGGLWPGLLATVLSAAVGTQFLPVAADRSLLEEWDRLTLFLLVGAIVTWHQVRVSAASDRIKSLLGREQAARSEAEAANKVKSDFLAAVSHELRSPLSVVIGWTTILKQATDPSSIRKAADVIERNAILQQRLVEDIVDTVRVSRGTMRLDRQRVDMASLVAAAVEATRPGTDARGIDLQVDIQPDETSVWGDPARLEQVLMNLLTNAVKFTTQGGSISIRLERVEDRVRVTVSDTGAGIDAALLPHIFEPFRKGSQSRYGLGLGLAIARHLVEMHGGSITATSAGPGHGSSFVVRLPLLASDGRKPMSYSARPPLSDRTSSPGEDAVTALRGRTPR